MKRVKSRFEVAFEETIKRDLAQAEREKLNLFRKTIRANKKYVEFVNNNDFRQIAQLEVCNELINEICAKGLINEYSKFCEFGK